jgi:hypothetical protein
MPLPINKGGRPKGRKNNLDTSSSLRKRIKLLNNIIDDTHASYTDRMHAVKLLTDILSDKVITSSTSGASKTVIEFKESIENKPIKNVAFSDIKTQDIVAKSNTTTIASTPPPIQAEPPQVVEVEQLTPNDTNFNFDFVIQKDNTNDI